MKRLSTADTCRIFGVTISEIESRQAAKIARTVIKSIKKSDFNALKKCIEC